MAAPTPRPLNPHDRSERVKSRATGLGFDSVGITHLDPVPHADALDRWLAEGMAGSMTYMHRQAERRKNPSRILPGTRYAIVITRNYYSPDPPGLNGRGRIARYARGPDYHQALKQPLEELAQFTRSLGPAGTTTRTYLDAGPVPERELAQRAGLGWIGKNTMLIDPERGSFHFLAAILTDLELSVDAPFEADRCGSCTRCLDACPTRAFKSERVLDATQCISYLTIEHRGDIPRAIQPQMGDWLFGCDICQDVCPWNRKFAQDADDPILGHSPTLAAIDLQELLRLDDAAFEKRYRWTVLERPGAVGMRRNARIAQANLRS
jgi:epoxyqueuosine reductase